MSELLNNSEKLNKGEHPINEVMHAIKAPGEGQILAIVAPFITAPLIDKSINMENKHQLNKISDNEY